MAALTFFAYFFLGLGPGISFFIFFLSSKSFLVLLTFFSTFLWLVVLLLTSAIFKGFLPLNETVSSYAGMLVGSVAIQEIVRHGVWWLNKRSVTMLETVARETERRFGLLDKLYIALAWGFGHAACHSIFFYLSFLPLTTGDGTFYLDVCPQMSLFLVGALYCLGFGMILCSITVVAFEGYLSRNWFHMVYAPAIHFGASLTTLGCFRQGGCMVAMPVVVSVGGLSAIYAGQMAWRKGMEEAIDPSMHAPLQGDTRSSRQQDLVSEGSGGDMAPASGTVSRRVTNTTINSS